MLLCHDLKRPIGAWKEWQERPEGLFVKGRITLASPTGQEAHALARDGGLTGISIGYTPKTKSFDSGARVLAEVDLFEASLVPVPMNDRTRVSAIKSIHGARDIAEMLQEAGLSSRKAKAAAGAAWKAIDQSEDEEAADAELVALIQNATARLAKGGR
jgi:phage head maturation protease